MVMMWVCFGFHRAHYLSQNAVDTRLIMIWMVTMVRIGGWSRLAGGRNYSANTPPRTRDGRNSGASSPHHPASQRGKILGAILGNPFSPIVE